MFRGRRELRLAYRPTVGICLWKPTRSTKEGVGLEAFFCQVIADESLSIEDVPYFSESDVIVTLSILLSKTTAICVVVLPPRCNRNTCMVIREVVCFRVKVYYVVNESDG